MPFLKICLLQTIYTSNRSWQYRGSNSESLIQAVFNTKVGRLVDQSIARIVAVKFILRLNDSLSMIISFTSYLVANLTSLAAAFIQYESARGRSRPLGTET